MKKETIAALVAVLLVTVMGILAYNMFKMNEQIDQLVAQNKQVESPQINIPKILGPTLPTPIPEDDFFKDRSWNPYEEMQHMQNEMEQMFNQSMSRLHMNTPLGSFNKMPDVDLQDQADQYLVTVNAPGADESTINVKLDDRLLSISIKTEQAKDESEDRSGKYKYRERFAGEFQRMLTLPGPGDATKMKTEYRNGVLTITIPKKNS